MTIVDQIVINRLRRTVMEEFLEVTAGLPLAVAATFARVDSKTLREWRRGKRPRMTRQKLERLQAVVAALREVPVLVARDGRQVHFNHWRPR